MTGIIVCGGRDFNDWQLLETSLYTILLGIDDEIEIITGGAKGADALAKKYAQENDYALKEFRADWKRYRRGAGPVRNAEMLKYALTLENAIVAGFWDGKSRGTADMLQKARAKGVKTYKIRYEK